MRILIVSPYPPDRCGVAAYTAQVAATLRREGHTVEVVSRTPSAAHHHADLHTLRGVMRVIALSRRCERTIVEFTADLLFRSLRSDQFLRSWPVVALLLAGCRGLELVVHEAPYDRMRRARGLRRWMAWMLWRHLLRRPRLVQVHTDWERQELAAAVGMPEQRIQLLDHGTAFVAHERDDRDRARRELGLDGNAFHFLSIGFLQSRKGFDRAVLALGRLPANSAQLHIVGSARIEHPEVMEYIRDLRALCAVTPGATLHEGYVSDVHFDRWIVACDAVVLPYRVIWSSGVLERAKLYDRPAIVSDVGGLRHQAAASTRVVRDDDELCWAMAHLAGVSPDSAAAEPRVPAAGEDSRDPAAVVRRRASRLRARYEPGAGRQIDAEVG